MIGEPLTPHTKQKSFSTLTVVHAQSGAVVVTEIELSKIAVQVIVPTVLIDTLHAAFKHREEAFNGVGVDAWVNLGNVFTLSVTGEALTAIKHVMDAAVLSGFVGHNASFTGDIGTQDWQDGGCLHIINDDRAGLSGRGRIRVRLEELGSDSN